MIKKEAGLGQSIHLPSRRGERSIASPGPARYTHGMRRLQRSRAGPAGIGLTDLLLLAEAIVALLWAWAALRWLPFSRVIDGASRPPSGKHRATDVDKLRWAVNRGARLAPWRALCFERALALQAMARRRGLPSVLHYGVRPNEDAMSAHVWLSMDGKLVIGGEASAEYACIATFPADRHRSPTT